MKVRLAALILWIAIALSLNCAIAPITQAQAIAPQAPNPSVEVTPSISAEKHKSFFTLSRDALSFSGFVQRDRTQPHKDPYQIITAARQRNQSTSPEISTKERIQQLKIQLPKQSKQLRSRIDELPHQVKDSVSKAKNSLISSVETTSRAYVQKTKSQPFIINTQSRIHQIKQRLKEIAVGILEQTSIQINKVANRLKD